MTERDKPYDYWFQQDHSTRIRSGCGDRLRAEPVNR